MENITITIAKEDAKLLDSVFCFAKNTRRDYVNDCINHGDVFGAKQEQGLIDKYDALHERLRTQIKEAG